MNDSRGGHATRPDDVDRIVAALIRDPSRADDIKDVLRQKLTAPDTVRVALPTRYNRSTEDDLDELWDNVPV